MHCPGQETNPGFHGLGGNGGERLAPRRVGYISWGRSAYKATIHLVDADCSIAADMLGRESISERYKKGFVVQKSNRRRLISAYAMPVVRHSLVNEDGSEEQSGQRDTRNAKRGKMKGGRGMLSVDSRSIPRPWLRRRVADSVQHRPVEDHADVGRPILQQAKIHFGGLER
jgi:hypothetical protein